MYEACESTCPECTSKAEVQNNNKKIYIYCCWEWIINHKEGYGKCWNNEREKNMKISSPQYESE